MGKPRLNISLLLARFFLRPVVSCHLTAAKIVACLTIAFPRVQDHGRSPLFCFPKRQKPSLLSDGERGRSLIRGRMQTLLAPPSLDFLKPVIHVIITPSDNS